jgi:DNA-binding transcriptional MerR regulator
MNIKEIKDSLQRNNFTGLRARLDTVIEFIDEQQAEIEALKKDLLKYDRLAWHDLTKAELESGLSRVQWAEALIKQLPEEHENRNSWLLNYGKAQQK